MDYSKIGLDSRLRSINSLGAKEKTLTSVEYESAFDVQSNKLNSSKVNLGEFVKRTNNGTAVGDFSTSQALYLTTSITYEPPKTYKKTFGKPIIGIYEGAGTDSADQIYPFRGSNVTYGRYEVTGGVIDYSNYGNVSDQWRAMIIDTNGTSSQQITLATSWLYLDYVTGNA